MRNFLLLLFFVLFGSVFSAYFFPLNPPSWLLISLLSIGLYGATSAIDISSLKTTKYAVLLAITKGVLFKSVFIGGLLYICFHDLLITSLGVILAQIDPISTARLTNTKSFLSEKGKSFINTLASFDDPMTFLLAFYIFTPLLLGHFIGFEGYILKIVLNLIFALFVYFIYKCIKSYLSIYLLWILLAIVFIVAISQELMLGIALIGLFLRPYKIDTISTFSVNISYFLALFLMGTMMIFSTYFLLIGVIAGVLAFFSHYFLIVILKKIEVLKLSNQDVFYLKFAQYNGITASLLSLHFAHFSPDIVSITIVSIVIIAFFYHFFNDFLYKNNPFLLQ